MLLNHPVEALIESNRRLARDLDAMSFEPPVACVYNPLSYAAETFEIYLKRFAARPKEVVFLGMNPGPFGMVQTGVPFGEINAVRDWMGIDGLIRQPASTHPKRPIDGFDCQRSEVSGRRVWDWAARRSGTPERFFERFFVANYCPLAFLEESGRNRTPDKLPLAERKRLFERCDEALAEAITLLQPRWVIGFGVFAEARARQVLDTRGVRLEDGSAPRLGRVLHPSPASPAANRGWEVQVEAQLRALAIALPGET